MLAGYLSMFLLGLPCISCLLLWGDFFFLRIVFSSLDFSSILLYCFIWGEGAHPILRTCSCLCTQELLLMGLGTIWTPGVWTLFGLWKARTLLIQCTIFSPPSLPLSLSLSPPLSLPPPRRNFCEFLLLSPLYSLVHIFHLYQILFSPSTPLSDYKFTKKKRKD